jgi:hypothetical protein
MWRVAIIGATLFALITLAAVKAPHGAQSAAPLECTGEYRWDIKTLADDDWDKVDLKPVNGGVADFWDTKKPPGFKSSIRNPGLETTTYRVKARLREARWVNEKSTPSRKGGDQDIHLVIEAITNPDRTMVVEFPHPNCVAAVPLLKKRMTAARKALMTKCKSGEPRTRFHKLSGTATITGVGFFDRPHAIGAAKSGVELHPVLRFSSSNCEWLD